MERQLTVAELGELQPCQHCGKQTYLYLLQRAIYIISRNDSIILGRGAHLLLKDALKVYYPFYRKTD